jgi:2-phosphosulfolactate phosphatase
MEVHLASLISGAEAARGTVVIIDVFRAFTTAAVAFSRGARRIIMVDTLAKALSLRSAGLGDYCVAARHGESVYAGALVNAEATVQAILRRAPAIVTLVAIGRGAVTRADEDEICALYLRSRLQGRKPDADAVRSLLSTMVPPPDADLIASGDYDPGDREIAAAIDAAPFAIRVRAEGEMLIATSELN